MGLYADGNFEICFPALCANRNFYVIDGGQHQAAREAVPKLGPELDTGMVCLLAFRITTARHAYPPGNSLLRYKVRFMAASSVRAVRTGR